MRRMEDMISGSDRTIIFVSHSTDAITRFCDRAAWIHKGQIREVGAADEVVRSYLSASNKQRSLHVVGSSTQAAPVKVPADGAASTAAGAPVVGRAADDSPVVTYALHHDGNLEPDAVARINRVALVDEDGVPRDVVFRDQPQIVEIGFSVLKGSAPPISCYIGLACSPRKGLAQRTVVLTHYCGRPEIRARILCGPACHPGQFAHKRALRHRGRP